MLNKLESGTSRHTEIDGRRCLPWLWSRFSPGSERGRKVHHELIVNNFISCSVSAPCTHSDVIEQIAKNAATPIPIESLPDDLTNNVFSRGQAIFGFPGDYFDQIARNYKNMWWSISGRGLKMTTMPTREVHIPPFDQLAGKLMRQAQAQQLSNGHLAPAAYMSIGAILDKGGFKPVNHLEGMVRENLAMWNKRHPLRAIHTFDQAMKLPWLRRGVKKRLYRAAAKFNKAHPQLSEL